MGKEFIPYEQALDLKELGFDEPCFGFYYPNGKLINIVTTGFPDDKKDCVFAPLYQQVFRWFREKYKLIFCNDYGSNEYFYWIISEDEQTFFENTDEKENVIIYKTYEEAELECLKKLIEMVKGE